MRNFQVMMIMTLVSHCLLMDSTCSMHNKVHYFRLVQLNTCQSLNVFEMFSFQCMEKSWVSLQLGHTITG